MGYMHGCGVMLSTGEVLCWGGGTNTGTSQFYSGSLPSGLYDDVSSGVDFTCVRAAATHHVTCFGEDAPVNVPQSTQMVRLSMACGPYACFSISSSTQGLVSWGDIAKYGSLPNIHIKGSCPGGNNSYGDSCEKSVDECHERGPNFVVRYDVCVLLSCIMLCGLINAINAPLHIPALRLLYMVRNWIGGRDGGCSVNLDNYSAMHRLQQCRYLYCPLGLDEHSHHHTPLAKTFCPQLGSILTTLPPLV